MSVVPANWAYPANITVSDLPTSWRLLTSADALPTIGHDYYKVKGLSAVLPLIQFNSVVWALCVNASTGILTWKDTRSSASFNWAAEGAAWLSMYDTAPSSVNPHLSHNTYARSSGRNHSHQVFGAWGGMVSTDDATGNVITGFADSDGMPSTLAVSTAFEPTDATNAVEPLHFTIAVLYTAPGSVAISDFHGDSYNNSDSHYALTAGFTGKNTSGAKSYFGLESTPWNSDNFAAHFSTFKELSDGPYFRNGAYYTISSAHNNIEAQEVAAATPVAYMGVLRHFNPVGAYHDNTNRAAWHYDNFYVVPEEAEEDEEVTCPSATATASCSCVAETPSTNYALLAAGIGLLAFALGASIFAAMSKMQQGTAPNWNFAPLGALFVGGVVMTIFGAVKV